MLSKLQERRGTKHKASYLPVQRDKPVLIIHLCAVCGMETSKFRIGDQVFCSKHCLKKWRKRKRSP